MEPKPETPPADDPFGAPAEPAKPETKPAEPPADDPFGDAAKPAVDPPADEKPLDASPDEEKSFFLPEGPAIPAEPKPAEDDPFGAPAEKPTDPDGVKKSAELPSDDPFGAPAEPAKPAEPKPAEDDPFGANLPLRKWSDDTGAFTIEARLVLILDGKVRLLKTTGRTTTVPVERLSQGDRAYVEQMIALHGHGPVGRVASK